MKIEQVIWIFVGAFGILCGIGLILVKIDKAALEKSTHSNPGLALFRFPLYRWTAAIICILVGLFSLSLAFGWL